MNDCKYCTLDLYSELPEYFDENKWRGRVFDSGIEYYFDELCGKYAYHLTMGNLSVQIKYCPFCGRKLEG